MVLSVSGIPLILALMGQELGLAWCIVPKRIDIKKLWMSVNILQNNKGSVDESKMKICFISFPPLQLGLTSSTVCHLFGEKAMFETNPEGRMKATEKYRRSI